MAVKADRPAPAPLLLVHGSRREGWAEPFRRLRALLRERCGPGELPLAFMEFAEPSLEQSLDALREAGTTSVRIIPLFLAAGVHLRRDIPEMIEAYCSRHPEMRIEIEQVLGEDEEFLQLLAEYLAARMNQ
jgi:sirohydrochlorin cobaltochelatase